MPWRRTGRVAALARLAQEKSPHATTVGEAHGPRRCEPVSEPTSRGRDALPDANEICYHPNVGSLSLRSVARASHATAFPCARRGHGGAVVGVVRLRFGFEEMDARITGARRDG